MKLALALAAAHPHELTLQYPPRREYFQEHYRTDANIRAARLLYVHVPFCAHRCSYCNFAVDLSPDEPRMERYVDALVARIEQVPSAEAIDVGGGTPTRLPARLLSRLLGALQRFDAPISIETTPELATPGLPVDRVSVGLQSSSTDVLRRVGRPALPGIEALRGYRRVNVDLVFGLPGQSDEQWTRDVAHAIELGPDAITTYDCLYRGKGRAMARRSLIAPSPARYQALYERGRAMLLAAGYHAPYGAMTYSRHPGETGTSLYFERRLLDGVSYLGVGNYATSHSGDTWTFESASIEGFLRGEPGDAYVLPREETIAKYLLLSLSFGRIDRRRYRARFDEELEDRFAAALAYARDRGWLVEDELGFGVGSFAAMPSVRALFYPPRALEWLARTISTNASAPREAPPAGTTTPT